MLFGIDPDQEKFETINLLRTGKVEDTHEIDAVGILKVEDTHEIDAVGILNTLIDFKDSGNLLIHGCPLFLLFFITQKGFSAWFVLNRQPPLHGRAAIL